MREHLQKLAGRFDALPRRERSLIAAAAGLAVLALFFFAALEPRLAVKKRLTGQVAELRASAAALQQQLTAQQGHDPRALRRAERDALRKQLADIDKTMGQVQRGLVPAERTARLLEQVLRSGSGLQLVSLRTLPVQRFDARSAPAGAAAGAPNEPERQLYQHGFELTVQGSYADLYEYLQRVEQLPWRLYWTRISLNADPDQPGKLLITLTVQTVSLSKAWLIV
jgi:MSHA biogenesis protein MshJ